jgi:hypothetical protein
MLRSVRAAAPAGVEPEYFFSAQLSVGILAEMLAGVQTTVKSRNLI